MAPPMPPPIKPHRIIGSRFPPFIPRLTSTWDTAVVLKAQILAPEPSSITTSVSRRIPW